MVTARKFISTGSWAHTHLLGPTLFSNPNSNSISHFFFTRSTVAASAILGMSTSTASLIMV